MVNAFTSIDIRMIFTQIASIKEIKSLLIKWGILEIYINSEISSHPSWEIFSFSFIDNRVDRIRRSSESLIALSSTWSLEWRMWMTPLTEEHLHAPIKQRDKKEGSMLYCCAPQLRQGRLAECLSQRTETLPVLTKTTAEFPQQIEIQF